MFNFFLTLHFIIAIFLTLVIIVQKKEGDGGGALGFGGGRADGAFTPRGEANILTKATYILAGLFVANCLLIGNLVDRSHPAAKDTLAADIAKHANVGIDSEKTTSAAHSKTTDSAKTNDKNATANDNATAKK